MRHADLVDRIQVELTKYHPGLILSHLTVVGQGLESLVFRADSNEWGTVAVRVPWTRWETNEHDGLVDNRELLIQGAIVANHLSEQGVPVPKVHLVHTEGDLDLSIAAYVPHDGSPVASREMGRVLAQIHRAPLPPIQPYWQRQCQLPELLASRIERRLKAVVAQAGLQLPLPMGWERPLSWEGAQVGLLHMDYRPANVLGHEGRLEAVVDWSNMLFGDVALELARIDECGNLNAEFLAGYGRSDVFSHLPSEVERLYRLDAALLLAIVFLCDSPDPVMAKRQVERVQALWSTIGAGPRS